MENILPHKEKAIIFDLKGSLVDRFVEGYEGIPTGKVLKDQNFITSHLKILLEEKQIAEIIKEIHIDVEILMSEHIMDYSILIGFYDKEIDNKENRYIINYKDKSYTLGIIDILQEYNFVKITEQKLKAIYKKNSIMMSVADPIMYFERIVHFLSNIFKKIEEI